MQVNQVLEQLETLPPIQRFIDVNSPFQIFPHLDYIITMNRICSTFSLATQHKQHIPEPCTWHFQKKNRCDHLINQIQPHNYSTLKWFFQFPYLEPRPNSFMMSNWHNNFVPQSNSVTSCKNVTSHTNLSDFTRILRCALLRE